MSSFHGQRPAPDEILAENTEEYLEFRKQTDVREPYRIAPRYLQGTKPFTGLTATETPLIAFINAKSGGYVGAKLANILCRALGQSQVFDVAACHPGHVLKALYANLEQAEAQGDKEASYIRRNLRILAAGGDGTITWILGSILKLGLSPMPAVGVMPLGTGNDLSLSLGWSNKFDWAWVKQPHNLYNTLVRYRDAEVRYLDVWNLAITAPSADFYKELPHSIQPNHTNPRQATGSFWNYFSIGLDAKAAYGFHSLRQKHPALASGRALNQAWYAMFTCSTGWFCGAPSLANTVKLRVRDTEESDWRDVPVPSSVRAIILLNLQSYGGGRDIWGLSCTKNLSKKNLVEPAYDDGLIEVVGFHDGWHTTAVMGGLSSNVHAKRLAQAHEVELTLQAHGGRVKDERGMTYCQVDGEPWPQAIPCDTVGPSKQQLQGIETVQPMVVKISHAGQSKLLYNGEHILGGKKIKELAVRGAELSSGRSSQLVALDSAGCEIIGSGTMSAIAE